MKRSLLMASLLVGSLFVGTANAVASHHGPCVTFCLDDRGWDDYLIGEYCLDWDGDGERDTFEPCTGIRIG